MTKTTKPTFNLGDPPHARRGGGVSRPIPLPLRLLNLLRVTCPGIPSTVASRRVKRLLPMRRHRISSANSAPHNAPPGANFSP